MPAPPVALRSFPQDDEVTVFAEIYQRSTNSLHTVDIVTTVTSSDGAIRFQQTDQRSSSDLEGKPGSYGHTTRIPMSQLQLGRYILTVEARSRLGPTASRKVPFEVVP
jgi:hypothetical protein